MSFTALAVVGATPTKMHRPHPLMAGLTAPEGGVVSPTMLQRPAMAARPDRVAAEGRVGTEIRTLGALVQAA